MARTQLKPPMPASLRQQCTIGIMDVYIPLPCLKTAAGLMPTDEQIAAALRSAQQHAATRLTSAPLGNTP